MQTGISAACRGPWNRPRLTGQANYSFSSLRTNWGWGRRSVDTLYVSPTIHQRPRGCGGQSTKFFRSSARKPGVAKGTVGDQASRWGYIGGLTGIVQRRPRKRHACTRFRKKTCPTRRRRKLVLGPRITFREYKRHAERRAQCGARGPASFPPARPFFRGIALAPEGDGWTPLGPAANRQQSGPAHAPQIVAAGATAAFTPSRVPIPGYNRGGRRATCGGFQLAANTYTTSCAQPLNCNGCPRPSTQQNHVHRSRPGVCRGTAPSSPNTPQETVVSGQTRAFTVSTHRWGLTRWRVGGSCGGQSWPATPLRPSAVLGGLQPSLRPSTLITPTTG